jgi:hypothetical protein
MIGGRQLMALIGSAMGGRLQRKPPANEKPEYWGTLRGIAEPNSTDVFQDGMQERGYFDRPRR